MAENITEFDICWSRGDEFAGVTCPNATAMKGRVMKLATEHPDEVKIITMNNDGSIFAHVPIRCVAIRWPRQVSVEQAEAAAQRFKQMWGDKKTESNEK